MMSSDLIYNTMYSAAQRGAKKIVLPEDSEKKKYPGEKCGDDKEAESVQGKVNQLPRQEGMDSKF